MQMKRKDGDRFLSKKLFAPYQIFVNSIPGYEFAPTIWHIYFDSQSCKS